MQYHNKAVEILSARKTFGRSVSQIRILATGQILDVPADEVQEDQLEVSLSELIFKAMAARIRNEVNTQKILAPFESNIIPLPHQILALEKIMSGNYLRFLLADEVGMGKTIETGLVLKELKLRGIVKRTLIIVPLSAMQQWRNEDALMPMLIEFDTLERVKRGVYKVGRQPTITHPAVAEFYVATDIALSGSKSIVLDEIKYRSWFFFNRVELPKNIKFKLLKMTEGRVGGGYVELR